MLQALLDRARESGYRAISLSTDAQQVEWYEGFGFETVAESPHAVTMVARL
jgi:ribosomal protein S18 acetylase RimI-like enzyme